MRRFAALLAVILLSACTNEIDQSTRPSSVVGTYQLRSYGGRSLPAVVSTQGGAVTEIMSGELVIGSDNSWSETRTYRLTDPSSSQMMSFAYSGSWTFLRDYAAMQFNLPALQLQFLGTAAGGSVTLSLSDGNTVVYSH